MKIALFTCHHDPNYGSMLQAYALSKALSKFGVESEYLNYSTLPDPYKPIRIIKRLIKTPFVWVYSKITKRKTGGEFAFFHTPEFASTIDAYERFHKLYIPVSSKKYYYDTIKQKLNVKDYDIYMVGSDQSWSPHLYKPNNPYFLDFANLPKRCSYAPSFGTTDLKDDYQQLLKQKLSYFDFLSCREAANSKLLTEIVGRKVTHVLDPTLLLTSDDWNKIAKAPNIKEDYILAYILGEKDTVVKFAEKLSVKHNLPVYYIVTRPKYLNKKKSIKGVGPDDWLGLIRGARYVVTDSFHGCLFCINYNVNFYAFSKREGDLNAQDNARILEFLGILGLQHRFQNDKDNPQMMQDIDFIPVNKQIEQLRERSVGYLKQCIED